jgi:hypothetical protein
MKNVTLCYDHRKPLAHLARRVDEDRVRGARGRIAHALQARDLHGLLHIRPSAAVRRPPAGRGIHPHLAVRVMPPAPHIPRDRHRQRVTRARGEVRDRNKAEGRDPLRLEATARVGMPAGLPNPTREHLALGRQHQGEEVAARHLLD